MRKKTKLPDSVIGPFNKLAVLLVAGALLAGCSADSRQARLLARAERYFANQKYEEAKIEYLNLLKGGSQDSTIFSRLGFIWAEQGAPEQALPFLVQARQLEPGDLEARIKLAYILPALGDIENAREEAREILKLDPRNEKALLLLADLAVTNEQITEVRTVHEGFAEKRTAAPHLAAAKIAALAGDRQAAEAEVREAVAVEPDSPLGHLALASILEASNELDAAREEYREAVSLAPARSGARLKYVEFERRNNRPEEARRILEVLTAEAPDYFPAWQQLAELAAAEERYDEALKLLDNISYRNPGSISLQLFRCRIWIAQGESDKAVENLRNLEKELSESPVLQFELARALLSKNDGRLAEIALKRAISLSPRYTEAILLLARLQLRMGEAREVVVSMEELLESEPDNPQVEMLLATAYRAVGRVEDAEKTFRAHLAKAPDDVQARFLLGLTLREQNRPEEARKVLEEAEERSPDNLLILSQLCELDFDEKQEGAAVDRVRRQLEKTPDSPGLHYLMGRIHARSNDWDQAEESLLRALELKNDFVGAYNLLVTVYLASDKLPAAIAQVESLLAKDPDNLPALMRAALMYQQGGDIGKAKSAYERVVALSPEFVPGLNNLAYLYSEYLNEPVKAYETAQKAHGLEPEDGSVADTLGWILHKRGEYPRALALLQESAEKIPDNPEVRFHLGMTLYRMGRAEEARENLTRAVSVEGDYPWKNEARDQLAVLAGSDGEAGDLPVADLEVMARDRPGDLVVLMRLGSAYRKEGSYDLAATAFAEVLRKQPEALPALVQLVSLYLGPLPDRKKALQFGKQARALAPDDPEIAALAGQAAFESGEYAWAFSLLEESLRSRSVDPERVRHYSWSAYSVGKVSEAIDAMRRYREEAPNSPHAAEAETFLALTTALHGEKPNPESLAERAREILAGEPRHLPALMVQAAVQRAEQDPMAAATYERILENYPDFSPAQKELAALYLRDPQKVEQAYALATKARKALPGDAGVARTLGIISFQKGDFYYAIELLEECAREQALDAEALYFLGAAQLRSRKESEGRKTLEGALEAGLEEPLRSRAQEALSK